MIQSVAKSNHTYISLQNICKSFGVTKAIDDSSMRINLGQITGLIGPNGAGKSTMMKIITGVYSQDSGEIIFPMLDKKASKYDTNTAREYGIYCVYQELSLATNLKVYENFLLNTMTHTPIGKPGFRKAAKLRTSNLLNEVFPENGIAANAMTSSLSMAQRQMVEICKAIDHDNLKVLLLDEPTSYLPTKRIQQLHAYLKKLCQKKIAIIYISHKLDEIAAICHTVNVMKNGKNVEIAETDHISKEEMVAMMGGLLLVLRKRRKQNRKRSPYFLN